MHCQSVGLTKMLESAYSKGGGCSAIGTVMDGEAPAVCVYLGVFVWGAWQWVRRGTPSELEAGGQGLPQLAADAGQASQGRWLSLDNWFGGSAALELA